MVLPENTLVRDKYRITRLIGDGGMGAVYEAEHLALKVPVALKFLHTDLAERPGLAERFLREARVSATIQSAHVARVTDVDTTEAGTPFLVMELLRGESLQALLDREQHLPLETSIDYALQILAALEAAHALDVVHRDLKPDNVFITGNNGGPLLKLIDFGIAKLRGSEEFKGTLTHAGSMMGTPEYMAPEQLYSAESVAARADIFSLGVILYEMLSGRRPVNGEEATEIVGQFLSGNVLRLKQLLPQAPDELDSIVHRALEPQREDRFESAFEMRTALVPLAGALSQAAQAAAHAPPPRPPRARDDSLVAAAPAPQPELVPDTLPPQQPSTEDDLPLQTRGDTEEAAPLARPGARGRGHASALAPPPSATAEQAGAEFRLRAANVPAPSPRRRPSKVLVSVLVLLLVGIASAMVVLLIRQRSSSLPPPDLELTSPPALQTVEADLPPTTPETDSPAVPETPQPDSKTSTPSNGPRPARPAPSASAPTTPPPFAFPSTLPPLPSGLPPLPSGFPTALPSFLPPIPGFSPPGAPTQQNQADPE